MVGSDFHFSSEDFLVVSVILFQQCGDVQFVGAARFAYAAFDAGFNFFHFRLHLFGQPGLGRRAAEHQGHPGALVDQNFLGAGRAVSAAAAEIAG